MKWQLLAILLHHALGQTAPEVSVRTTPMIKQVFLGRCGWHAVAQVGSAHTQNAHTLSLTVRDRVRRLVTQWRNIAMACGPSLEQRQRFRSRTRYCTAPQTSCKTRTGRKAQPPSDTGRSWTGYDLSEETPRFLNDVLSTGTLDRIRELCPTILRSGQAAFRMELRQQYTG